MGLMPENKTKYAANPVFYAEKEKATGNTFHNLLPARPACPGPGNKRTP
jgi:hypothetical protein